MKSLLVFVHPKKHIKADYHREMEFLYKVQVDNHLAFGWDRKDIMMVTNFPYEYNGVETIVLPDTVCEPFKKTVSKVSAINWLYDIGFIEDIEDLVWFHDFDALQNAPLGKIELGDKDLALTPSSGDLKLFSTGILYFKESARDLFFALENECYCINQDEEKALHSLIKQDGSHITDRLLTLNLSHNFAIRKSDVARNYALADHPIKVLHFHPFDKRLCTFEEGKTVKQVLWGDNSMKRELLSPTLKQVLRYHHYSV